MPDNDNMEWDEPIAPGSAFVLLKDDDYIGIVVSCERKRRETRNGPANVAELKIEVQTPEGTATVQDNLWMKRKAQFRLYQFFTSIGQRAHGEDETLTPKWNEVVGSAVKLRTKQAEIDSTRPGGGKFTVVNVDRYLEMTGEERQQALSAASQSEQAPPPAAGTPPAMDAPPATAEWYMQIDGAQAGPFTLGQLKQKGITGTSKVWKAGMPAWVEASTIPEVAALFVNFSEEGIDDIPF